MRRIVAWASMLLVLGLAGVGVFYLIEGSPPQRGDASAMTAPTGAPTDAELAPDASTAAGDAEASAPHVVVERAAQPATTPVTPSAVTSGQLPATGLPLHETAADLLVAHRGGNLKATRRLMDELTACMGYRRSSLNMDMAIAFQDGGGRREGREGRGGRGEERLQRWLSTAAESVAELREDCENLPEDYDQELLFELQRRAAEGGDLAGQLSFALVPAVSLNQSLLQLDRLEIYRELAPQMLQRAMEQGSAQAVAGFMQGYEFFFEGWRGRGQESSAMQTQAIQRMLRTVRPLTPIQQVLGEDLTQAYGYALLCKRVCNAQDRELADAALLRLGSALELAQVDTAQEHANTLYDRHFATRARPDDIDLEALRQAIVGFGGRGRGGG